MEPSTFGFHRAVIVLALLLVISAPAALAQKTWKGITSVWDNGITANWLSNGVASTYADGDFVMFDETATGYTVAGTNLQPGSVLFTNSTHNYILSAVKSDIRLYGGIIQSACIVPTNVTWWVEFNDNLPGPPWTPLVLPQTGTGAVQTMTDPINGRLQRFYRWRQVP